MLGKAVGPLAALLVAVLVLIVTPAANAINGVEVNLSTFNNSSTPVTAAHCPFPGVEYKFGRTHDPCHKAHSFGAQLRAHGGHFKDYKSNPIGVVVSAAGHHTLYIYVRNPSIGRPFFELNGHKLSMVEGQVTRMHVAGATVEFQRPGDSHGYKNMVINLIKMGLA